MNESTSQNVELVYTNSDAKNSWQSTEQLEYTVYNISHTVIPNPTVTYNIYLHSLNVGIQPKHNFKSYLPITSEPKLKLGVQDKLEG